MPSVVELLHEARSYQQAGDLHRAAKAYLQVVRGDPGNADAWFRFGSVLHGQGKPAEAVESFHEALRLLPQSSEAHHALGAALAALGRRNEAAGHHREALRLRPDYPEALADLGVLLAEQGELAEGTELLRRAALVRPENAKVRNNLGVALAQAGKPAEAEAALREALRLEPAYAEACYNLGNVLRDQGKRDEAIAHFRAALGLKPDYADAANNLGLTLTESGRPAEAAVVLRHALRLKPSAAEAHNNLGLALTDLGRFADAEASYSEALRLKPSYDEAINNLASCWKEQGRLDEALAGYDLATLYRPDHAPTRWNRSLALLQSGDYARGWAEYEWRWRRPQTPPRPFRQPRWDGAALEGRTILLWMEQGLGDMIQFVRYAARVKARGGNVVVECPGFLVPLFSTCAGIDQLVAEGQPLPAFDVHAPLMSLPFLLGTTRETIPAEVPYLHADAGRVERWRKELAGGFRVGVVWQGNPHNQWDRHRSFPLAALEPLAAVEGVQLISLQKDHGLEQLRALKGRFPVRELAGEFDPPGSGFLDTAAVIKNLNLVVTADTATAHLAGALGMPAWVALAQICDWRWLRGREDSPWYPTVRLFRQERLGDWPGLFARMAAVLAGVTATRGRSPVKVETTPGELIDRISILRIKAERVVDPDRRARVQADLASLERRRDEALKPSEALARLTEALRAVNERLWDAEDALRLCERRADFGPRFVETARSICRLNDERADLKRRVTALFGDDPGEEKVYQDGP